jgi:hypothetical protein
VAAAVAAATAAATPSPFSQSPASASPASPAFAAQTGLDDVIALPHRVVSSVARVAAVGAVSWRGRSPLTHKINQDAVMIAEHSVRLAWEE